MLEDLTNEVNEDLKLWRKMYYLITTQTFKELFERVTDIERWYLIYLIRAQELVRLQHIIKTHRVWKLDELPSFMIRNIAAQKGVTNYSRKTIQALIEEMKSRGIERDSRLPERSQEASG